MVFMYLKIMTVKIWVSLGETFHFIEQLKLQMKVGWIL